MDRKQVIEKIQAILKLQEGTTFDGEADNAAKMIDMLCKKYGVTIDEATEVQVDDEVFLKFKKINVAYATLLNAIAYFYDAKAYLKTDVNGNKTIQVIGSEAQQIQVRIYFDYLVDCMEKETETAHKAEKIIAQLQGTKLSRSFKTNFRKGFAEQVMNRLQDKKKQEGRVHEHKAVTDKALSTRRFNTSRRMNGATGYGGNAGASAGGSVSLNRQASGASQKQIVGV
tara:strand:+ start:2064 stop:2744 length:681 start_codon:yes stop_codon:yes gene_type:complete